jgi:putative ABC transport system permease protein
MKSLSLHLSLWRRLTLRHWLGETGQSLLLLLILSLGVGAYFSIRLANRAATSGFEQFHGAIQTQSDAIIRNRNGPLRTEDLRILREALDPLPAQLAPVVEESALFAPNGEMPPIDATPPTLRVIGLDLVQLQNAAEERWGGLLAESWRGPGETAEGLQPLLDDPHAIWISPQRADAWGAAPGDSVTLLLGDRIEEFRVRGLLPRTGRSGEIPDYLVVLDLPDLQRLTGKIGIYDRVEVIIPPGLLRDAFRRSLIDQLKKVPYRVEDPSENKTGEEMTAAFRLNLTILSLIALLVSLYLITQALDASVVRRRSEIATLRSLGFTTRMIRRFWLLEWLIFGLCGGFGGLLLGWLLAQGTAGAVAQTVNALYFGVNDPNPVTPHALDWGLALLLGVGGSLVAGWLPLRDAASTPPAQVLAAGNFTAGFGIFRHHRWGLGLILLGIAGWQLPALPLAGGARFPLAGYLTAFLWLIGGTLVLGLLFPLISRLLQLGESRWVSLRLARSRLAEPSGRHRLAAAGLFVAFAMAAAMSILVGSFSRTMESWIDVRFQADVFGSSGGLRSATARQTISPETWRAIAGRPEVAAIDPFLVVPVEIEGKSTFLAGSDFSLLGERQYLLWITPPPHWPVSADAVFINEAFGARLEVETGDVVEIALPNGENVALRVSGVFADYGNERGTLLVDRHRLATWWQTDEITNFSLWLQPGNDPVAFTATLSSQYPTLAIRENGRLRAGILKIFRQTFAVTEALKYLGILVALIGLALAQINLLRESRRELATLRSLGATRHTIGWATAGEGLGIALVGVIGGLAASIALGALLIFVINRQSFGWTLLFALPLRELGLLVLSTLLLSIAVGFGVGYRLGALKRNLAS